jgi:hypothetical protein
MIAAIPFEHPKLAVTAICLMTGVFAKELEAVVNRSGRILEPER